VGIGCGVAIWFDDLNDDLEKSQAAFILFIGIEKENCSRK